ncbi:hypothetical protein [Roseivirga thermotolerans]|uniref:Uncharacterized protein n=1 Tax=Roseivirga thermotolerans TaxID=1758176 RepID=A0ABQ3IAG9_9BACT|nr:hypothetical protein [Roseivirga thermotolerans]GHE65080.1 hypothetical protein GCM10011340_20150 [Roseivirga thermotolerans]
MTENQRFKEAVEHLQESGELKYKKDLMHIMQVKHERVRSVLKEGGPKLDNLELIQLRKKFPHINWDWVVSGEGEMLKVAERNIQDPETVYQSKAWKKAELIKIKSRTSTLDKDEQIELLLERLAETEQALMDIQEINQRGWLDTMKELIKGK